MRGANSRRNDEPTVLYVCSLLRRASIARALIRMLRARTSMRVVGSAAVGVLVRRVSVRGTTIPTIAVSATVVPMPVSAVLR